MAGEAGNAIQELQDKLAAREHDSEVIASEYQSIMCQLRSQQQCMHALKNALRQEHAQRMYAQPTEELLSQKARQMHFRFERVQLQRNATAADLAFHQRCRMMDQTKAGMNITSIVDSVADDGSIQQQQQQVPDYVSLASPFSPSELDAAASKWSVPSSMNLPNMFMMSPRPSPAPGLMQFPDTA